MFERYTEKARRSIFFARYEASQVGSEAIDTECLLLGLLREDTMLIDQFMGGEETAKSIRTRVREARVKRPSLPTSVDMPLSRECKLALAYGAEEAERLHHRHIGTDHLLLGLLREEATLASKILQEFGVTLEKARGLVVPGPSTAFTEQRRGIAGSIQHATVRGLTQDWFVLFHRATNETRDAITGARQKAFGLRGHAIETRHLLLALLDDNGIVNRYFPEGSPAAEIHQALAPGEAPRETVAFMDLATTQECAAAIQRAIDEADERKHPKLLPDHLIIGLLRVDGVAGHILKAYKIGIDSVRATLARVEAPPPSDLQGGNYV